jgi:hypothetical protein
MFLYVNNLNKPNKLSWYTTNAIELKHIKK